MNPEILNQNIDETLREHINSNIESSEVVLDEELVEVEETTIDDIGEIIEESEEVEIEAHDDFVDDIETELPDSIEIE